MRKTDFNNLKDILKIPEDFWINMLANNYWQNLVIYHLCIYESIHGLMASIEA